MVSNITLYLVFSVPAFLNLVRGNICEMTKSVSVFLRTSSNLLLQFGALKVEDKDPVNEECPWPVWTFRSGIRFGIWRLQTWQRDPV